MIHTQPEHSAAKIRPEGLDYCPELLPGSAVILFGRGESFIVVGYYYFLAIVDLRQHSTDIVVAGVRIQDVFPSGVGVGQDRHSKQATLETVERLLFDLGQLPGNSLCGESI